MLTIHLRFNDAHTKKPTPVRLRITDDQGEYYAPWGRLVEFATGPGECLGGHLRLGGQAFAYIDGSCEIRLPSGVPLRIQASKGPEYQVLDQSITLGVGQMSLRFEMVPVPGFRAAGWLSADARVHELDPFVAVLEASAEGLDLVQVLALATERLAHDGNVYPHLPQLASYSGQEPALQKFGTTVCVNTLNAHPVLGSLALLHTHRIVHPLAFGGHNGPDDWSLMDWCDQAHRKNGLVIWAKAYQSDSSLGGGEALVAAILGKIDAIEYDPAPRRLPFLPCYYRLLNAGLMLPLVGSSGKLSNRVVVGAMRTYAQTCPEDSDRPAHVAWVNAVRLGRTLVSNGPMIELLREGPTLRLLAKSAVPFEKLELVQNGQVIARVTANLSDTVMTATLDFAVPGDFAGWFAGRVTGPPSRLDPTSPVFAHTSPLWCQREHFSGNPKAIVALQDQVRAYQEWVQVQGRFEESKFQNAMQSYGEEAWQILERSTKS